MAAPSDVIPRRPTLLFIVVLCLLFVLMSMSTRTRYIGETRTLFERTVMTIFSPVPRTVNWIGQAASDMYHGYLDMRRAVNENLALHRKVADLTAENLKLSQSQTDLQRLRSLLGYSEQFSMKTSLAHAIMLDTSSRFKSIVIDRGSADGVDVNDAVVNANGLIGRVVLTTNDMAKVQLISDSSAAVGALVERTRRQGVVRGDGGGGAQMYEVPSLADVQPGDAVLTAGIDGIFPKGIPVGTVTRVDRGQSLSKSIWVKPAVDFGSIEEVIVIHTRKIPEQVVRYTP
ncbi:MAG TPA: rod shape-determining protein MreC [Thermoanaerobaculia bacterium]|jgi:rod shape-determining protein MreC|nr:rod shape-determining protein MreC [Thermoanaerobaculia bacterium]